MDTWLISFLGICSDILVCENKKGFAFIMKIYFLSKYLYLPEDLPAIAEQQVSDVLLDSSQDHLSTTPVQRTKALQINCHTFKCLD